MRRIKPSSLTQEQVNEKVENCLAKVGAQNHLQARFFSNLGKEVLGSTNPSLHLLKSRVKDRKELAWILATELIIDFLKNSKMDLTSDVFKIENKTIIKKSTNIVNCLRVHNRENAIQELLANNSRFRMLSLREREIVM